MVAAFRATDTATPVVLMGYANPIEAMGTATLRRSRARSRRRRRAGRRLSARRSGRFRGAAGEARHRADLPAGADDARGAHRRPSAKVARGYVYYVSLKGVTGAGHLDTAESRASSPKSASTSRCRSAWASASATRRARGDRGATPTPSSSAAASSRRSKQGRPPTAAERAGAWLAGIRSALDSMPDKRAAGSQRRFASRSGCGTFGRIGGRRR